jgi:hypothetical protein
MLRYYDALTLLVIVTLSVGASYAFISLSITDKAAITSAAGNLVSVAGLLSAASVALTFFYLGEFLKSASPVIEQRRSGFLKKFQESLTTVVQDAQKKGRNPLQDLQSNPSPILLKAVQPIRDEVGGLMTFSRNVIATGFGSRYRKVSTLRLAQDFANFSLRSFTLLLRVPQLSSRICILSSTMGWQ